MKTCKITHILSTAALALAATLFFAPHALAATDKTKLNNADTRFIQDEAAAGDALVKLAKLGEKNAQRADIKAFATMLVADHSKANAELSALAAEKGITLSSQPVSKYVGIQEKLERTSEANFDKEFLSVVVSGHEKCVKKFQEASTDAKDSDVKAWATKMLPGMQTHLGKAEELSGVSAAKNDTTSTNSAATQADNTARNKRDRDMKTLTPIDQGNNKADIDTTAQIRREIMDTKGLSVNAQNVKIITNEGRVTLRGPVNSADEKRIIGEIADRVAKEGNTDNQLEVRSTTAAN